VSPRFPSSVIDQMLTRGQITRVAPNRAQSDQSGLLGVSVLARLQGHSVADVELALADTGIFIQQLLVSSA